LLECCKGSYGIDVTQTNSWILMLASKLHWRSIAMTTMATAGRAGADGRDGDKSLPVFKGLD
jgi:hypothetical protein